jgi:hypothetical protein
MRPESDVYSIDTDDSPEIYSIRTGDAFEERLSGLLADDDPTATAAIGSGKSSASRRDDRKSSRNPVPKSRRACELKVGGDLLPAVLVDESAGGFAVLIDRVEGLKSGKRAEFHTDMGWCKVRIVYIKKSAAPAGADAKSDCWFRLGLRKQRSFFLF